MWSLSILSKGLHHHGRNSAASSFTVCHRGKVSMSTQTHTEKAGTLPSTNPRPFSEMPGPRGLPVIGSLLDLPNHVGKAHIALQSRFEEFGPIFKEKLGLMEMVNTKDVVTVEKLHRLNEKYPSRITIGPWNRWREENNLAKGILLELVYLVN